MTVGFPDGFWWGTGASSTQCEGAAPASDWYREEQRGTYPRSGDGNGFATRYAEDFAHYAELGLTHHRLSIEWARIEPEEGRRDQAAIEHYRAILQAARDAGVAPWVCLHHFTLPGWFTEVGEGAFCDDRARSYHWARHVAFCAETFGDLVFGWKPINEPFAYAALSYQLGVHPPRQHNFDRMLDAYRGILLAQRDAWRELRGAGTPVATIHNLSPLFPADDSVPAERNTRDIDALMWGVWMRADRDGVLALPGRADEEVADLRECCDLVGFSYYSANAVERDRRFSPYPRDARVGPLGYAPWSEGLGIVLHRLHDELPNRPLLICEHGVGTDDDEWRADILRASLAIVAEAIGDGVDVRGFFHWTGVDNYEWTYGYDVAFGLMTRDREVRPSAAVLTEHTVRR
ncbi:MAG: family 1 glycosylhydrolase [Acidimicrobiia bacterium]